MEKDAYSSDLLYHSCWGIRREAGCFSAGECIFRDNTHAFDGIVPYTSIISNLIRFVLIYVIQTPSPFGLTRYLITMDLHKLR